MNLGFITISYYSLSILTGIILGYILVSIRAKRYGISTDHIDNLLILTLPVAILGARLYHIFAEWSYYKDNTNEIFSLQIHGLGIFGALIGGLMVFIIYSKVKRLNVWALLDLGSLGLLVGQIVGRFGNFFNKELYGAPTNLPWKVFIPIENRIRGYEDLEYFHPTFFYESIWNLVGLIALLYYEKILPHAYAGQANPPVHLRQARCKRKEGMVFSIYLIWYGIGRFIIGFIRIEPNDLWIFNDGQILSFLILILGLATLHFRKIFRDGK